MNIYQLAKKPELDSTAEDNFCHSHSEIKELKTKQKGMQIELHRSELRNIKSCKPKFCNEHCTVVRCFLLASFRKRTEELQANCANLLREPDSGDCIAIALISVLERTGEKMIQSPLIRILGGVGLGLSYTMENPCHTVTSFSSQKKLQLWATNVTGKFLQQPAPKLHALTATECTERGGRGRLLEAC